MELYTILKTDLAGKVTKEQRGEFRDHAGLERIQKQDSNIICWWGQEGIDILAKIASFVPKTDNQKQEETYQTTIQDRPALLALARTMLDLINNTRAAAGQAEVDFEQFEDAVKKKL